MKESRRKIEDERSKMKESRAQNPELLTMIQSVTLAYLFTRLATADGPGMPWQTGLAEGTGLPSKTNWGKS